MFHMQERQLLLSSLFEKPIHNAVRRVSCFLMQTVQTLIRCRILWHLIWVYTVLKGPIYRMLGINGLIQINM